MARMGLSERLAWHPGWLGLHHLLSDADDNHQATLDRRDDPGGHLRGGVAVAGAHGAAQVLGAAEIDRVQERIAEREEW